MLNELRDKLHSNSVAHGFYSDDDNFENLLGNTGSNWDSYKHSKVAERLMLINSEISEALEADRINRYAKLDCKSSECDLGLPDEKRWFETKVKSTVEDELADALIRILDMCGWLNIDIESHVELKHQYNCMRPYKHGKKY